MRKVLKLMSVLLFSTLLVAGCSCKKGDEVIVKTNIKLALKEDSEKIKILGPKKLKALIDDKENNSFILYVYEKTCGGCKAFDPYLIRDVEEMNLKVYKIEANYYQKDFKDIVGTPTVIIYENGKVKVEINELNNTEYFTFDDKNNVDGFKKFLNKYVNFIDPNLEASA